MRASVRACVCTPVHRRVCVICALARVHESMCACEHVCVPTCASAGVNTSVRSIDRRSPYEVSISTGAPHGCVLSPFLYTMYTNSCRSAYSNNHYFKYADDTALVGLVSDDETDYRSDIDHVVSWCVANCLE